jgi:hypothetical protein
MQYWHAFCGNPTLFLFAQIHSQNSDLLEKKNGSGAPMAAKNRNLYSCHTFHIIWFKYLLLAEEAFFHLCSQQI